MRGARQTECQEKRRIPALLADSAADRVLEFKQMDDIGKAKE
jgi:hypothetical protein